MNSGHLYSGENWINNALSVFSNTADRTGLAESLLLKGKFLRYQGRYQESLEAVEKAIPDLSLPEVEYRFDIPLERSYTLIMCGKFLEAESVLLSALNHAEKRGDIILLTYIYEGLGNLYFAWGYPDRSLYYYRRGIEISPDKSLNNYYFQDSVGMIYLDWGEIDRAYEYLEQCVVAKESFGLIESLPSSYLQIGDILLELGKIEKSEEYYRKALTLMKTHGGDHFILALTYLSLAVCLGSQGKMVEAGEFVEKARNEATVQSEYVRALFGMIEAFFFA